MTLRQRLPRSLGLQREGFVRLKVDGAPGGAPLVLPPLPVPTAELHRAPPHVLRVVRESVQLTYELESVRLLIGSALLAVGATIYEARCPDYVKEFSFARWVNESPLSRATEDSSEMK